MKLHNCVVAGLGLAVFALSAPADTSISSIDAVHTWLNTQTQKYHCDNMSVIRCETTAGGTCFAIESCEAYCYDHNNGASCIDMVASRDTVTVSDDIDIPMPNLKLPVAELVARTASREGKKHYTCSKDGTGVLLCRYGFCQTDHYCKAGEACSDGCNCCKRKSRGGKAEVRTEPSATVGAAGDITAREASPQENKNYICSKDRASVLKCTYGFCSTDRYCAKRKRCVDNPARCK